LRTGPRRGGHLPPRETCHRHQHAILGSRYANLFLLPGVRMFSPTGPVIRQLALNVAINRQISSLYSVFDPHIPETSHLDGAENIVLPTVGHFRLIGNSLTVETIDRILTAWPKVNPTDAPPALANGLATTSFFSGRSSGSSVTS
jgi:hypothetical protein